MMFDWCRQYQIALNLNKCILCSPFGILLGHVVCKHGLIMDLANISIIVTLPPPTSMQQLGEMLGHTWYYRKFIKGYV